MKKRLTIDVKANVIIVIIALILLATAVVFLFATNKLIGTVSNIAQDSSSLERISHLQLMARSMTLPAQDFLLNHNSDNIRMFNNLATDFDTKLKDTRGKTLNGNHQARADADKINASLAQIRHTANQLFHTTGSSRDAMVLKDTLDKQINKLVNEVNELHALSLNNISTKSYDSKQIGQQIRIIQIFVVCIALITLLFVPIYMHRFVASPMRRSFNLIVDLASSLATSSNGLNENATSINETAKEVVQVLGEVAEAAGEQSNSAEELSDIATSISSAIDAAAEGSGTQATRIGETVEQLRKLTEAIDTVTQNAELVSNVANDATKTATHGKGAVIDIITEMERIKDTTLSSAEKIQALGEKSKQIGEIIEVIDDIAGQTNLLALNAAIEAARAGEHGKGFAVVADEVGKLAERSTRATGEIAELIKGIQDETIEAVASMEHGTAEVEAGVELAGKAGTSIEQVMTSINDVVKRISQVAEAAQQMVELNKEVGGEIDQIAGLADNTKAATVQIKSDISNVTDGIAMIATITQEAASSTEDVSANMEQQNVAIEAIADSAAELSSMSSRLEELMAELNI
ncbi:MAG TPA: methyl-accepting chemotaxis protein [Candidatus Aquicultor sp.]